MSGFKLAVTLASSVPPHDAWTALILDNMERGGKLRLDYGTGRSSTNGAHKTAHQVDVRTQEVDGRILYIAEGLHLAADELGRRFVAIARSVFDNYENKKPRRTKQGLKTRKPKQMWFHLVASTSEGERLDHANLELTRNDREEINGAAANDDDLDAGDVVASEGSQAPATKFLHRLMRRDQEREAVLLQTVDRSAEQVRLAIEQSKASADQARAMADQFDALATAQQGFFQTAVEVISRAADTHLEATIAKRDAEYATMTTESRGLWDTPAGDMIQGQLVGLLERAQDPETVSDFLGRVMAKGLDFYERLQKARAKASA